MSLTSSTHFSNQARFISRITGAIKRKEQLSFLVGSALTAPNKETREPGVLCVADIIKKVDEIFIHTPDYSDYQSTVSIGNSAAERYQNAMKFLLECHGQQELNKVIQQAVLGARTNALISTFDGEFERLEKEANGWHLRPGVKSLGELIAAFPATFSNPTLTTNFDPILEISLRKAGIEAQAVFLSGDGQFDNVSGGSVHRVVHLHGYWHGSDTLHTPTQLKRPRPKLKGSLREHMRKTCLVILGYGGWEDVFTKSLLEVIEEERSTINVIWCFYDNNEEELIKNNALFQAIEPALGGRLMAYKGIDCHVAIPTILERALQESVDTPPSIAESKDVATKLQIFVSDKSNNDVAVHTQSAAILILQEIDAEQDLDCDSPPSVSTWVGRSDELENIRNSNASVIAITGMGGKGKSMLASKYIKDSCERNSMIQWDWRDLREEGNTIQKELLSIICRVSKGRLRPSMFVGASNEFIVKTLIKEIGDNPWLIVLDNVDHYIDLDESVATSILDIIIKSTLQQSTNSSLHLIITCRPSMEYADSKFLEISMTGFSLQETKELCKLRNVKVESEKPEDLLALHTATEGHPLWINLIATQVGKNKAKLRVLFEKIQRGKGTEIPLAMLKSIWDTLNDKQRFVLQCMAELTHPESEDQIAKYLASRLNWNQFSKAMRALRSLNLVIIRSIDEEKKGEKVELHPLIREFIRFEYSDTERREFIAPIVRYFQEKLVLSRPKQTSQIISINTLDVWIIKAELESNVGMIDAALETLLEAYYSLMVNGLSETFVRIADKIISQIDWTLPLFSETNKFYNLIMFTVRALSELGRFLEADSLLDKIYNTSHGKNVTYISYCAMRCYTFWLRKSLDEAIYWGDEGSKYITLPQKKVENECLYNLALAKRDTGRTKEVDEALEYFLDGISLEKIFDYERLTHNTGNFYGNIGRCLFLKGDYDKALLAYCHSALLLAKGSAFIESQNRGYASLWIGEALEKKGDKLNAYLFYRLAAHQFSFFLQAKAELATEHANALVLRHSILRDLGTVEDWRIQQSCATWLSEFMEKTLSCAVPVPTTLEQAVRS